MTDPLKTTQETCTCRPGHDYLGVGGGIFLFNEKGEVLLMRRTAKARNRAGMWMKPGGWIEKGEHVKEALVREAEEELGLKIEVGEFISFDEEILEEDGQHWIALNFEARMIGGTLENREPEKHDQIGWFALDALPQPLAGNTERPLRDWLLRQNNGAVKNT